MADEFTAARKPLDTEGMNILKLQVPKDWRKTVLVKEMLDTVDYFSLGLDFQIQTSGWI